MKSEKSDELKKVNKIRSELILEGGMDEIILKMAEPYKENPEKFADMVERMPVSDDIKGAFL